MQSGITVDLTTNTMFSAGFLAIPKKQSVYGRGSNNTYDINSTSSWGTVMDGTIRNQWDPFLKGKPRLSVFAYWEKQLQKFFGTWVCNQ